MKEVYLVLHIVGVLMVFAGLCGIWGAYLGGQAPSKNRRIGLALIHGIGLAIVLVSGMGRLALLGIQGFPGWVIGKGLVWLALGGTLVLAKRRADMGLKLIFLWLALGAIAVYLAVFKPF